MVQQTKIINDFWIVVEQYQRNRMGLIYCHLQNTLVCLKWKRWIDIVSLLSWTQKRTLIIVQLNLGPENSHFVEAIVETWIFHPLIFQCVLNLICDFYFYVLFSRYPHIYFTQTVLYILQVNVVYKGFLPMDMYDRGASSLLPWANIYVYS